MLEITENDYGRKIVRIDKKDLTSIHKIEMTVSVYRRTPVYCFQENRNRYEEEQKEITNKIEQIFLKQ